MNATPPVSQTLIASEPAQQSPAAPANSVKSAANGQDFAAALNNAGAKPTRKAATPKPADAGSAGGHLPAPGNLSPPPASPIVAGSAAASAAATIAGTLGGAGTPGATGSTSIGTAVGAASGTAVGTAAGIAAGTTAFSGAQAKVADQNAGGAPGDSPVAVSGTQGAARPGAGSTLALGLPVAGLAAAPNGEGAATTGAAAGVAAALHAAAASEIQAGTAAGTGAGVAAGMATTRSAAGVAAAAASTAHAGVAAGAAARTDGKPITGAAATAATSRSTGTTDGTMASSTNTGAWTSTDATTQAVTAAAMSAAATGAVASGDAGVAGTADSPSTPTVDLTLPAAGAAAQGAGGPKGPPVPALAISVAGPVAAAAAKAAAAAPAATTLASAIAADKRAPGGTGDSLLSGTPGDAMAGAAQLSGNTTGVTDTIPAPTLKVAAGVDTPEFGQGLADRVSWMVDNNLNGAKLQVNPPQLGPIEVRIAVQGNHAQVWLTSHSAVTRDALESSSPKLREMLGAQGFGQVNVDISQRSYQERSAHSQPYAWTPSASGSPAAAAVQSTASPLPRISSGSVDAYA